MNNNNTINSTSTTTATPVISASEARVERDAEGRINIFPLSSVGPVRVEIHYHHYEAASASTSSTKGEVDAPRVTTPDATLSSSSLSPSGMAGTEIPYVRLLVPGTSNYVSVGADRSVVVQATVDDTASVFELIDRGGIDNARHISLRNRLSQRNLRINAKGDVDCGGGFGRYTLFDMREDDDNRVTLRSIANENKLNTSSVEGWFLGLDAGNVIGNGAPFLFILEKCNIPQKETKEMKEARAHRLAAREAVKEAAMAQRMAAKAQRDAERIAAKEARITNARAQRDAAKEAAIARRMAAKQLSTERMTEHITAKDAQSSAAKAQRKADHLAARDARFASKSERMAAVKEAKEAKTTRNSQAAVDVTDSKGNWTLVLKPGKPKSVPMSAITVVPVLTEFPRGGIVSLAPIAFHSFQNRRGGVGWNIGVSPQGFIVADTSQQSTWGHWKVISTDNDASVMFQSVHTSGFHLSITPDRLIRHNGSGDVAKFVPERVANGFMLRSTAHVDVPAYLAVNASGLLYASSSSESKDVVFVVSPLPEVHQD